MNTYRRTTFQDVPAPPSKWPKREPERAHVNLPRHVAGARKNDAQHPCRRTPAPESTPAGTPRSRTGSDLPGGGGPPPGPAPWFGRTSTDVSEHLHRAPPSHVGPADKPPAAAVDVENRTPETRWAHETNSNPSAALLNHWWPDTGDRPGTVPLAVPPQYVSREDLYAALPQRRTPRGGCADAPPTPRPQSLPGTTDLEDRFRQPSPVDIVNTPRSVVETPRSVLDNVPDQKLGSSGRSDIGRQSLGSTTGAGVRQSLPCRSKSCNRNRAKGESEQPAKLEPARPRFRAGGVVRPLPPQEPVRPTRFRSTRPSPRTSLVRGAAGQLGGAAPTPPAAARRGGTAGTPFVQRNLYPWRG